jgi:hypothetical protein
VDSFAIAKNQQRGLPFFNAHQSISRRESQTWINRLREPPEPALIGIVQFSIDEGREEWRRENEAVNLLMSCSPLSHDPMRGADTWNAELIVVDDESLEAPSFDDTSKGYRIWLRS